MVGWWGSSDEETNLDDSSGEITVGHFFILISRPGPRCYYHYCNCNYFSKLRRKCRRRGRGRGRRRRRRGLDFTNFCPFYIAQFPLLFSFSFFIIRATCDFRNCFGIFSFWKLRFRLYIFTQFSFWFLSFIFTAFNLCLQKHLLF